MRAKHPTAEMDLQARGMDLFERGKWKGTVDCQIVSRESGCCTMRGGGTARLGHLCHSSFDMCTATEEYC